MGGWSVVSESPATGTPPPAAAGSGSPWSVVSESPATAGEENGGGGGLGGWLEQAHDIPAAEMAGPGTGLAIGAVKSAGRGLSTILNFLSHASTPSGYIAEYKAKNPGATDEQADQQFQTELKQYKLGRVLGHVQDAAKWLRTGTEPTGAMEHVGAIGEQLLEYMGGEGLLKLAGVGLEAGEGLKAAQQMATTLKASPKLAGLAAIGLKAVQEAIMMGAQTYAHTEDAKESAVAAAFGGTLSAGLGGAQAALERIAPKNVEIGTSGVKTPALASQVNEAGRIMDTGAIGAPKIARAQQKAAQKVTQDMAARATANALGEINRTRADFGAPIENGQRLLEAGEPAENAGDYGAVNNEPGKGAGQRFLFTLGEAPGTTEEAEGPLTQSPRKKQIGTKVVERAEGPANRPQTVDYQAAQRPTAQGANVREINPETGEGPALEEGQAVSTNARRLVKEPQFQYMSDTRPGSPEPRRDVVTGGGSVSTADPQKAQSWLRQIEDWQNDPEMMGMLSDAQQTRLETMRKGLQERLGMYYSSPYHTRFAPVDIADAVGKVRSLGDGADQVFAAAEPIYQTLDKVSGGEFNKAKEAVKQAQGVLQRSSTMEAYDAAQQRLNEANGKILDIIDRNRSAVSLQDYMEAKNAWRNGSRMAELHAIFEGMSNGVTLKESDEGYTRVVTGKAKRLESYIKQHRDQLEKLMGNDGLLNLKQNTLMLAKANTARTMTNVLRNVAAEMHRAVQTGGIPEMGAGLIGTKLAEMIGLPGYAGFMAGAGGARAVLHFAATNPRVGNMVEYAVRNGISAQQYAPLIARTIAEPFQQQQEEQ